MKTVTLFIPTLNESEGMKRILPRIDRSRIDQVLVVDGNSTDDTVEVARSFGCEVMVQSKPGLRHAYIEGYKKVRGEIIVTFSPDGNCIPELIPALIDKVNSGYDMVIASRYAKGAKSEDDDLLTGLGNWVFTRMINILHAGAYTDAFGIYRAYRTQIFYDLELDQEDAYSPEKIAQTIMGIEPILSVRAAKAKLKVGEIPGDEPARIAGIRKLQAFRWGLAYLIQVWRELFVWRGEASKLALANRAKNTLKVGNAG